MKASVVANVAATITVEPAALSDIARSSRIRATIGKPFAASAAASASTNALSLTAAGFQPPASPSSGTATSASASIAHIGAAASSTSAPARRRIGEGSIVMPTRSMYSTRPMPPTALTNATAVSGNITAILPSARCPGATPAIWPPRSTPAANTAAISPAMRGWRSRCATAPPAQATAAIAATSSSASSQSGGMSRYASAAACGCRALTPAFARRRCVAETR